MCKTVTHWEKQFSTDSANFQADCRPNMYASRSAQHYQTEDDEGQVWPRKNITFCPRPFRTGPKNHWYSTHLSHLYESCHAVKITEPVSTLETILTSRNAYRHNRSGLANKILSNNPVKNDSRDLAGQRLICHYNSMLYGHWSTYPLQFSCLIQLISFGHFIAAWGYWYNHFRQAPEAKLRQTVLRGIWMRDR